MGSWHRRYKDFSTNGIGACPLGYANKYVDSSVVKGIKDGSMSSLNSYEEVHLAELLTFMTHGQKWQDLQEPVEKLARLVFGLLEHI